MKKVEWLVFFYSIPSQPTRNRVRFWRKMSKAGFISFRGSVYILPYSLDNFELCQWLTSEIVNSNGEAAFIKTGSIEGVSQKELVSLFKSKRKADYLQVERCLELLETKIQSENISLMQTKNAKLISQIDKLLSELEEIKRIDFFPSPLAKTLNDRAMALRTKIGNFEKGVHDVPQPLIKLRNQREYQKKIWLTRSRPFVDRIASAWLISRFIDRQAKFRFIKRQSVANVDRKYISFDIDGGDFSHVDDLCTFEVLLRSFRLPRKALRKIAEIVHELDLRDGKFRVPEADGLYEVIVGIRKSGSDDHGCLEKGMLVFDMLYSAKS
ncbi:MAG: chromate resistance protein [FCB group bacterium]|nr:chromate resistance protein [FCB group bacterium]